MNTRQGNKGYEWIIYPQAYFCTAKLILTELSKNYDYLTGDKHGVSTDGFLHSKIFKRMGFPPHPDIELAVPALFLFKHGTELYLKALNGKTKGGHDILKLASDAELSLEAKKIIKQLSNLPLSKNFNDTKNEVGRYPVTKMGLDISVDRFKFVNKIYVEETIKNIDFLQQELRELYISKSTYSKE